MAKLASLVVDLQLQSAQLRQGLDEANRKLDAFAKQAETTGNILAGALSFEFLKEGLTALALFVKGGADAADAMGDLAASVGVPVEELSKLAYAAEFSGSSTEAVGKALAKTADLMAKALVPTSEQAAQFRALGVSVTDADGKLRASADVFRDISQRFAETSDGTAKTALAIELFGNEGAKLIPLLNEGKAGLAKFGEEAARTGNVITEKGAAGAAQFNDAIDRLTKAGEGLAIRIAQDLAPSVAAFAEELTTSKHSAEAFETLAKALTTTLRLLASAGVVVATTFDVVGKSAAGAGAWVSALFDDDATSSRSGEAASAAGKAIMSSLEAEGRQFRAIWSKDGPGAAMAEDAAKARPGADALVTAIEREREAAERAAAAQKKLAEATRKAAEEAARAGDERVKSALALERQLLAFDKAAEKRRSEANGDSPTAGFADFEDALARMVAAQKEAASQRAQAAELDKGGDILGADDATWKADEFSEVAERAGRAADAFRDMAKTAEEKAAQLFDEQVAATAALERQFDDIDREVASRRSAAVERDPTAGFANFHAALDAMAEALKREATLRAEASALERAGKLGEARQALLAAEATRALAETSSMAADALREMDAAAARAPGELAGMLAPSGAATSAMLQGVQTGAAAGPMGAVAGGVVGLLSQSESFQNALAALESIFQTLADSLGTLVEPLMPLLYVVGEVAAGLGALFEALSPLIEWVARPLFEVLKGFGIVVLNLVRLIGEVINNFVDLFGGERFDLSGIGAALARLENASYDSAQEQMKVAEAAREMTDAGALNVPSWWKAEAARFNATDPSERGSAGGTTTVNDNSVTEIHVSTDTDDPVAVAELVMDMLEEKTYRSTGTKVEYGGAP